jgi:photosystem II stability/assembly factor-like uncharacterized protein
MKLRSPGLRRACSKVLTALVILAAAPHVRGQSGVWEVNGPQGGNVYCVAADPSHPATLYAGTALGVFKSVDGGANWAASGAGMPAARVQTIVIDPSATNTLYAGTLTPSGVPSLGIFKSTDGAANWTSINNGLIDPIYGFSPVDVAALAFDPSNSQTLLAGTRLSEIFKSTDGGATWQAKTNGGFDLALEVSSFQFDPSHPATVYAASTQGLLQSTDGGETWDFFGDAGIPLFVLAIDPTSPSVIYAGDDTGFGILKSTDGGNHWIQMNNSLPNNSGAGGSGWPLVICLAVDPANHSTIYAGTYGNGLFQSKDGAATWAPVNSGMRDAYIAALSFVGNPSAIFAGTLGGGIYQSSDGAQTWSATNKGLDLALITALALDPAHPGTVFAAAFDGVQKTSDGGASWGPVTNGLPVDPVAALAVMPGSPAVLFAGTLGGGLFKSGDGGSTWTPSAQGLSDSYVSSIAVDPSTPTTLYAGTAHPSTGSSERVFKSTDGGATWTQTTLDASVFTIDFIAVNPGNPSQVLAGSSNVTAYFQSLDAGKTWATITPSTGCGGVNAFLFNASGSTLYLGGTAGVCRTTDNAATWIPSAVGSYSVASLAIDPFRPGTLYAGTALDVATNTSAVFRSTDGGQTWAPLGTGFPPAAARALVMDRSETLRAGTRGSGVAQLSIIESQSPIPPPPSSSGRQTRAVTPR